MHVHGFGGIGKGAVGGDDHAFHHPEVTQSRFQYPQQKMVIIVKIESNRAARDLAMIVARRFRRKTDNRSASATTANATAFGSSARPMANEPGPVDRDT